MKSKKPKKALKPYKSKIIGIIAEDDSDVETLSVLIKKISSKPFSIKKQIGHGCGKINRKCSAWVENLKLRQCSLLILLHDLDRKNHAILYSELSAAVSPCPISKYCIVIAIEELEAWLLSDPDSLRKTFNLKKSPKTPINPERVKSPKQFLGNLISKASENSRTYLNTKHNVIIAEHLSLAQLISRCNSFSPLYNFVKENFI